jgi:hypothetical protein
MSTDDLKALLEKLKEGTLVQEPTLQGFQNMVSSPTAQAPQKMSGGGPAGMDQPPTLQGDLPTDGSSDYAVATGGDDSTLTAPAQASQAPEAPAPQPAPAAPVAQAAPAPSPAASKPAGKPDPVQLMQSMVGNDPNQYQQLISSLQDSDKRASFAKALAVIGDTLGNMGNARAGQTPQGFTSLNAVNGITDQTRQRLIDQLQMKVAADPNSQSSKLAQQSLMQALNIGPNDPRAKSIAQMPAAAIVQQLPALGDSVKLQLQRESNQLAAKQLDASIQNTKAQQEIAQGKEQTERQGQLATAAGDLAKSTSIINPLNSQAKGFLAGQLNGNNSSQASGVTTKVINGQVYHKINGQWYQQ